MSNQLDWYFDEEADDENTIQTEQSRWRRNPFTFWLVILLLCGGLFGGWYAGQSQIERAEAIAQSEIQATLDVAHQAFVAGDGELFATTFLSDPAWLVAQLRPENQAFYRGQPEVTRVKQYETVTLANLRWQAEGETLQRVAFFQKRNGRIQQVATASDYWGERQIATYEWGTLTFYEQDSELQTAVADFITKQIEVACATKCLEQNLPLRVTLNNEFEVAMEVHHINLLSPRLIALDEANQPAPLFWQQLTHAINSTLIPTTIRFAIPSDFHQVVDYQRAAKAFTAIYQDMHVELVVVDEMTPKTLEVERLDGAAFMPTEAMLAAGYVRDLTPYMYADSGFQSADFYDQIWQGAWWQERMWVVPQAADMPIIFYDQAAYINAEHSQPSLRWTWDEMATDMPILTAAGNGPAWGFLDVRRDALFSYAYNWNNDCQVETIRCQRPLTDDAVAAALTWYRDMIVAEEMPDLTQLTPRERELALVNYQSAHRQAALWVGEVVNLEHYMQLGAVGVVPLPGSDRFDGITPLWLEGNFMTAQTQHPYAMWQWLKFLSYQPPRANHRLVPARPSIAVRTRYWNTLPLPIGNALRTAFPFARPVLIEEQNRFTWAQLTAVVADEGEVEGAAKQPLVDWFQ